jgi:hypothetical protein
MEVFLPCVQWWKVDRDASSLSPVISGGRISVPGQHRPDFSQQLSAHPLPVDFVNVVQEWPNRRWLAHRFAYALTEQRELRFDFAHGSQTPGLPEGIGHRAGSLNGMIRHALQGRGEGRRVLHHGPVIACQRTLQSLKASVR